MTKETTISKGTTMADLENEFSRLCDTPGNEVAKRRFSLAIARKFETKMPNSYCRNALWAANALIAGEIDKSDLKSFGDAIYKVPNGKDKQTNVARNIALALTFEDASESAREVARCARQVDEDQQAAYLWQCNTLIANIREARA